MNKKLTAAIISLIVIISLLLGIYVSSAYDQASAGTPEPVTGEQTEDTAEVTDEPGGNTAEETGTAEVTGEETREETGEVTGEDTGEDTGEETGEETGEVTGEDTGDVTDTAEITDTEAPIVLTGIEFEFETYRLHTGDEVQLKVKPIPEELELPEISFYSSDDEKAEVSSEGVLRAQKNGKVTVTAVTKDGEFSCSCTVIISSSDIRFVVINETGEKILAGFRLGVTVSDIVTDICTSEEIGPEEVTVRNADGTEASGNSSVATGLVFSVSGVEYTAIIYGDCNGDGMINAKDTQAVADYITGKITLDRAFLIAAGVTDGGNVTIENALVIQRHVYGLALIEQ